jgi:Cu/Ag efflux pump CusA
MARRRIVLLIGLSALGVLLLAAGGGYIGYRWLNRLAPAPIVIEVVAPYPGASAEEVERQVAIPLEVALAGLPALALTRSRSSPGQCELRLHFDHHIGYLAARQEVINRLQGIGNLPVPVTPQLSGALPGDAVLRLTLTGPRNALGQEIYRLHDLTALRDGVVVRELLRVPGVACVKEVGGAVKRYEVQPDPERMRRFGITLGHIEKALAAGNANAGGILDGAAALNVRGVGLIGNGLDPMQGALAAKDAPSAASHLRAEEKRRLRELRQIVLTTINQVPVRVEDVVDGSPLPPGEASEQGVVIDTRKLPGDRVQAVVLRRQGEDTPVLLHALRDRIGSLNVTPGKLLPGIRIEITGEGEEAVEPDDFAEAFEAAPGGGVVRIFGPDLAGLEQAAEEVRKQLAAAPGVEEVKALRLYGGVRLSLVADRPKCARWGVAVADVMACLRAGLGGAPCTQMIEGDQLYDVMVRWPQRCCRDEKALLDLPITTSVAGASGVAGAPSTTGIGPQQAISQVPRLYLRHVVIEQDKDDPFGRREVRAIHRENGQRLISVRFQASSTAAKEARQVLSLPAPYRVEWVWRP